MTRRVVLIVDDDTDIIELVKMYLERDGHVVLTAQNGTQALELARARRPDAIVLDLMLPGIDGGTVCRTLRKESDVPIIMLTALTTEKDKVTGLDLGADDYITKPFSPKELAARVRVVLRRLPGKIQRPVELKYGILYLNSERFEATIDGKPLSLTATEYGLFATLAKTPGRVLSRNELVSAVMGCEYQGFDHTIDSHLSNLRRKIQMTFPSQRLLIKPVYGLGYKLVIGP